MADGRWQKAITGILRYLTAIWKPSYIERDLKFLRRKGEREKEKERMQHRTGLMPDSLIFLVKAQYFILKLYIPLKYWTINDLLYIVDPM